MSGSDFQMRKIVLVGAASCELIENLSWNQALNFLDMVWFQQSNLNSGLRGGTQFNLKGFSQFQAGFSANLFHSYESNKAAIVSHETLHRAPTATHLHSSDCSGLDYSGLVWRELLTCSVLSKQTDGPFLYRGLWASSQGSGPSAG